MVVGMSLPMSALAALAIVLSRFVTSDLFFKLSDSRLIPLPAVWHSLASFPICIGNRFDGIWALLFHSNRLSS